MIRFFAFAKFYVETDVDLRCNALSEDIEMIDVFTFSVDIRAISFKSYVASRAYFVILLKLF